jgi:hypothetical protein
MSTFAPDPQIIGTLWTMLAAPGRFNRVAWIMPGETRPFHMDYALEEGDAWRRMVLRAGEDCDVQVSAGLRPRRGFGTCGSSRVLWARSDAKEQAERLLRFKPTPTLVLREGATCRMTALWELRDELNYEWLLRANRRIAHKLFGPKKHTAPEFEFNAPGTCLRAGRTRPVPIHVERFEPAALYRPRDVVGRLKEAPDPDAWRERAAA